MIVNILGCIITSELIIMIVNMLGCIITTIMVITIIEMVKSPEQWDKMAREHGRQGWQQEPHSGKWDPS